MRKKTSTTENVTETTMTPSQYFDSVKQMKEQTTSDSLKHTLEAAEKELKQFKILRQDDAANRYMQYIRMLEKEVKIVEAGFTQYVTSETIKKYSELVKDKGVFICEIQEYTRSIPEEIFNRIENHMDLFDHLFIMFTDYTQTSSKEIAKSARDKDPILFGAVEIAKRSTNNFMLGPRWYFIGDWVEPDCDLTLAEIIKKFDEEKMNEEVVHTLTGEPMDRAAIKKESKAFQDQIKNGNLDLKDFAHSVSEENE